MVTRRMGKHALLTLVVLSTWPYFRVGNAQGQDRLWLTGLQINGQSAHIAFDTGSANPILYRRAVERLGLKTYRTSGRSTEFTDCTLGFDDATQKMTFAVIDSQPYMSEELDGVIGWPGVSNLVIEVGLEQDTFAITTNSPSYPEGWSKWRLVPHLPVVVFEGLDSKEPARIGLDTGSYDGVLLSPERWQKWLTQHARRPLTIDASYTDAEGPLVKEVQRAGSITIGALSLLDVPVALVNPVPYGFFGRCDAILGAFALKRMKLVIDGREGVVYTCPIAHSSAKYSYNRLGAVFVPDDVNKSDDLISHVITDSPAYRAGIRNGDVLLKIGLLNVTKWRTDPTILPLGRFWTQPAGTKHKLTLKRGDKVYETTVTLEDLPAVD
jgi:hypothetical protein